jgi:hypothetical protein
MTAITYSLKKVDLIEFNEYHAKMTGAYGKGITRHQLLWPFIIAAMGLYIVVAQKNVELGMLFLITAFVWSLAVPSIMRKRFHQHVSDCYTIEHIAEAIGKRTIVASKKGLTEKKADDDHVYAWADISKFEQTKTHIFLYVSDDSAMIIPKDALIEGDIDLFVEEAITHIKNSSN